ncbi:hypothetical protein N8J89_12820 [Crossiella sp. CA-258035]|uniref:hypothetical protein n=1 Tax=Crossiella sp. CA-258035 TaxID=2981138 RepID=UPI0024BD1DD6|nr:hypothetical protein [Crossiella sp. CA-258035]WHT21903.1 hypothetical protein N8J89_12820 [Crossiella sp. CA-258035]
MSRKKNWARGGFTSVTGLNEADRSRAAAYLPPWAAGLGLYPASLISHYAASAPEALPWVSAGMALAGGALTGVTWLAASARAQVTRIHSTLTTGLASLWFTSATIADPTEPVLWGSWAIAAPAVALSWNIRHLLRNSGSETAGGGLFEKVKLAGVQARQIEVAPGRVTAQLQLPAGEMTVADVQGATGQMASAMRLPGNSVRIAPDPDDASQAKMTIVPVDLLRHPRPYPGPSAPGGSITEALVVGTYEDGQPQCLYLPGCKATRRNATHVIVQGMNGSGKSHGAKLCWTEILTRRDVNLVVMDPSKGEQTVGFLGEHTPVVIGQNKCADLITRITDLITERATDLGRWGYDQWTPEVYAKHGMPYLVIWVEEAPRVLEDAKTLARIAQEARSAGISLVLSLQKASFRQMPTDVRSQLGAVWCFGVNSIEDAAFTLSDELIEAGANPAAWKNRKPGANYLEAPGIEEERFTVPGRTFDGQDDELAQVIAATAHLRAPLHPAVARHLGLSTPIPGAAGAAKQQGGALSATFTPSLDPLDRELSDAEENTPLTGPANHEPDLEVDLDAELPEADETPFGRPRPTKQEVRKFMADRITQLVKEGKTRITTRDFPDPERYLGRTRGWVSGELARLAAQGQLREIGEDNRAVVYEIPTRDAHAA